MFEFIRNFESSSSMVFSYAEFAYIAIGLGIAIGIVKDYLKNSDDNYKKNNNRNQIDIIKQFYAINTFLKKKVNPMCFLIKSK